jgi:RNA polymerase subunit RPABC4/transcription elongation factor Spt4
MNCNKCDSVINDGAEYCSNCGEKIENQSFNKIKHCKYCDVKIKDDAAFCMNCAKPLSDIPITSEDTSIPLDVKLKPAWWLSCFMFPTGTIVACALDSAEWSKRGARNWSLVWIILLTYLISLNIGSLLNPKLVILDLNVSTTGMWRNYFQHSDFELHQLGEVAFTLIAVAMIILIVTLLCHRILPKPTRKQH